MPIDPQSSELGPRDRLQAQGNQESAERRALAEARQDFRAPAGVDKALEKRLSDLERWRSQLRGDNGITVQGEVIRLSGVGGNTSGNQSGFGRLVLTLSKNGIPTDYSIDAVEIL